MTCTVRSLSILSVGLLSVAGPAPRITAQGNAAPPNTTLSNTALPSKTPAKTTKLDITPLLRLLKSGRVPPERQGPIVNLICQRGGDEELLYVYQRVVEPGGFPRELRLQALDGLADAAQTRKKRPKIDDLNGLAKLLADDDRATRQAALRLAGAWKAGSLAPAAEKIALAADASDELRQTALDALAAMHAETARRTIDRLLAAEDRHRQALGLAALAGLDLDRAALRAAAMLGRSPAAADVGIVFGALLKRKDGADKLAAALRSTAIPADAAKLALRRMYLSGHSDAALVDVLGKAAGIGAEGPPPTPEQLQRLVAEVMAKGDPARGEAIFRRGDLGCMKCHSVSGAGGDVGPDLSAVGATSPVDYVITSILHPDLNIKENFLTRSFVTSEGKIFQGIVVDRDDKRVVIKDASGQKSTIATADIEQEAEGRSLMPKGLAGFLTHAEFLDVVRFVSQLGKPGDYAVRSQPTIQRWRYLKSTPSEVAADNPDSATVARLVLAADESQWLPAYAKVAGALPLDELFANKKGDSEHGGSKDKDGDKNVGEKNGGKKIVILRGDVDVTAAGPIAIKLDSPAGLRVWIDDQELDANGPLVSQVASGPHRILLRVDTAQRHRPEVRVVVDKPSGSSAVCTVVGGP
jgi:putative heme-binding domain-containing protein